jgi:hypothetical protein
MKDKELKKYKYIFTNYKENSKLSFIETTLEQAIIKLARMVCSVADWNVKKFKV